MRPLCELVEGVIVVAVAINVVRVKLIDIVLEVYDEVTAASGLWII
jgi:hypothetical protein